MAKFLSYQPTKFGDDPFLLLFKILLTAEFLGQMLYYLPDHAEALIDTGLVVVSTAFIQAGKRNIDRGMVVAATHKTPHLVFI